MNNTMQNFQLYRTNVLLGGQMKYDIILGSDNDELVVKDFHITPISKSTPYNKYSQDSLLNYTHQENVRNFYKKTSGSFYKDFADPLLTSDWPLPTGYTGEVCDTTYEMGCRRMSYQLYRKQFEFLCPVWIEKLDSIEDLEFCFKFYSNSSQESLIAQKSLTFTKGSEYHKKFAYYMDSYMKYIGLKDGCDWVIDLTNKYSIINGLNVKSGERIDDLSLPRLYENLKTREKPLIESDNMIIRELENNSLITKQLFNFNFCFNIEDFEMVYVDDLMFKNNIYVTIEVRVKNNPCELVDIFSNYEYIQKTVCSPHVLFPSESSKNYIRINATHKNVLDYLYDYKCASIIYKNKIIQNVCHWSLSEHPEYLFNLYSGFESLIKDEYSNLYSVQSNMGAPIESLVLLMGNDINYEKYSPMKHQYWCNVYSIGNPGDSLWGPVLNNLFRYTSKYSEIFSVFHKNCIVRNVRYGVNINDNNNTFHFAIMDTTPDKLLINQKYSDKFNSLFDAISSNYQNDSNTSNLWKIIKQDNTCVWYVRNDNNNIYIILRLVDSTNKLITHSSIKHYLEELTNNNNSYFDDLRIFLEIISKRQPLNQNQISLPHSLQVKRTNGPNSSLHIEEVEYIKDNVNSKQLLRTLGKIKPFFITKNNPLLYKNYKHYKKVLGNNSGDYKWNNYENQQYKYRPNYPSIDYFSLYHKDENYDFEDNLKIMPEYHHFGYNKIQYIPSIIDNTIVVNLEDNVHSKIKECLRNYFANHEFQSFVEDLYEYKILSLEFIDPIGNEQECKVQFKLK